jgi:hypothetical protein
MPDGHRTAELRSIALHRLVAERLDDDGVERARARVDGWLATGGPVPPESAARWRVLLAQPVAVIAESLTEDTEEMRDLRQTTPFAGVISAQQRWRVIRDVR